MNAQPIGDEPGHISSEDDALPERPLGDIADARDRFGEGIWCGNELKEMQVPNGVEEVGAEEMLPESSL